MLDIIDMDKICSGCLVYERFIKNAKDADICVGYVIKDTGCPCQHCLIKPMCLTSCDELNKRRWPNLSDVGELVNRLKISQ
jgi:hypothetical protein